MSGSELSPHVTPRTIDVEQRTTATPEHVWAAWTDPARIAQWFADRASGEATPGKSITMGFDGFGEMSYPVLEVVPGERIAFGGELPGRPAYRLEITVRRDAGETVVLLVYSGFLGGEERWDREYEGVDSGWRMALALLAVYAERHFGTAKRTLMIVRPARADLARVRDWFTREDLLARWLTRRGAVGDVGSPVDLETREGRAIHGRVIARTPTEVSFTWDDARLVLEGKAFHAGPQAMLGVRVTGWDADAALLDALAVELEGSVGRLLEAVGGG